MTATYHGQADVAQWCGGVSWSVISNWIRRHPDTFPKPDVIIINGDGRLPIRGWQPERRPEWEAFAATRKRKLSASSSAAAVSRRNRRAAEMIAQGAEDGTIDPAEAVRLLRELI